MEDKSILAKNAYHSLLAACRQVLDVNNKTLLREAFEIALNAHYARWKDAQDNYMYHSIEVARIVANDFGLGLTSVISALLHNAVDDKTITLDFIRKKFGTQVRDIITGYRKITAIDTKKLSEQTESFRIFYLSYINDIRVVLLKLAHRLVDIKNINSLNANEKEIVLREVHLLYAPIAHRLGLYKIKTELEDLWLLNTHKEIYQEIQNQIRQSDKRRNQFIKSFIAPIEKELTRQNFSYEIKGRSKSIYSIWNKMVKQNVQFDQVYDLFAIRIIIDSPDETEKADCWRVYSLVTDIYQPNPSRLRDWISIQKASGYRSLHTTVMGPNHKWVEVQIRTKKMDEVAEKGLAAHWKYKDSGKKQEFDDWQLQMRQALENPEPMAFEQEHKSKMALYSKSIFVFTPMGELYKLTQGSTILDFAYDLHTSLGNMCRGAKVNNKSVSLRYVLENGDNVKIITSRNQKPKADWLDIVTTDKAKSKIRKAIRDEKAREAEAGKEILIRKLKNKKIPFTDLLVDKLLKYFEYKNAHDLYINIASGKIDLTVIRQILALEPVEDKIRDEILPPQFIEKQKTLPADMDSYQLDEFLDKLGYILAPCCNPIPPDPVFGFISVSKGIIIHSRYCPNARQLLSRYRYRVIDINWKKIQPPEFWVVTIKVSGEDRLGIAQEITQVVAGSNIDVQSLQLESNKKKGRFRGTLTLHIKEPDKLKDLLYRIRKVKGISKATRIKNEPSV